MTATNDISDIIATLEYAGGSVKHALIEMHEAYSHYAWYEHEYKQAKDMIRCVDEEIKFIRRVIEGANAKNDFISIHELRYLMEVYANPNIGINVNSKTRHLIARAFIRSYEWGDDKHSIVESE